MLDSEFLYIIIELAKDLLKQIVVVYDSNSYIPKAWQANKIGALAGKRELNSLSQGLRQGFTRLH